MRADVPARRRATRPSARGLAVAARRRADVEPKPVLDRALDGGVERVEPVQRERLGQPKRRCGAASGPWWVSTQCASASRRVFVEAGAARALVDASAGRARRGRAAGPRRSARSRRRASARACGRCRGAARRQQQVLVEPRMHRAGLDRERRDRDRVLEQAAEVGVVAVARRGVAPQVGAHGSSPSTAPSSAR